MMIPTPRLFGLAAPLVLLVAAVSQGALASAPAGAQGLTDPMTTIALKSLQDEYDLLITGHSARPLVGHIGEFGDVQTGAERTEATLRRRTLDARDGLRFVNASVRLTDVTVDQSPVGITVRGTEWYMLGFESDRYPYDPGRTITKGRLGHAFHFSLDGGRWVLTDDESEHHTSRGPSPVRPSAPMPKPAELIRPTGERNSGSLGHLARPSSAGFYQWDAAARYADQYALTTNSAYRSWEPNEDCTNFLSQSLAAGGWQQLGGFYRDWSTWVYGSSSQSETWVNVDAMLSFMQTSGRAQFMPYLTDMLIGDTIQVVGSIHHSMIVDDRWGGYLDQIFVDYHSNDRYHRPLQDFLNAEASLGHTNNYYAEHIVGTS